VKASLQKALFRRPKAIVFDWDNTLIDSWRSIQDAQNYTLAHFGLEPWSLEKVRRRVRGSMRDSYPELFGNRWREAGEIFYARFAARHMETLAPLPGAGEMLAELSAAGIYLAVVSNKKGDYLRKEAGHLGWNRFFGRIVGAFDAARDKPSIEPVDLALSGSGIARGLDVWFAGDADIDMECAGKAGCLAVLLRHDEPAANEFLSYAPAFHVQNCMALCKLVRNALS
jgi:phosphoglycolate phosphatase